MPLVVLVVCFAAFAAGAVIALRAANLIRRSLQASRWPTTVATLLMAQDQDVSGAEDTNHRINVRYSYEVEGLAHEGNTLHPCYGGGSRFGPAHSELVAVLQPGQRYRIHHHPDRTEQSMMSAGFHLLSVIPLSVGLELMLLATAVPMRFGQSPRLGDGLMVLGGLLGGLMLVVLLIGSDRFAPRIVRIPS